ncbi:Fic family protein [Blastochloris sulfoviridis]|uniref:Fic family protein n=1 Tax=Blastochloris sulfoviridis TaxID=50712 RepID=A0A5M6HN10_9HYPH|nr:Fic family protein [Blastochloris sulfoviridis]KAA5597243.1 Fic family protein [Blastochloris sulfoviridis]
MASLIPEVLERLHLTHDVVAAMRQIGEGKGKQDLFKERAPEVLESLRQVAIIESTESSNRLEGVTLPRTVLEKIVRQGQEPHPENRSEGEVAGYRNVLQLIHERYEHMDVAPNVMLQMHRDLFRFVGGTTGGEWKRSDNLITERRPDGSIFVRFTPTPAWQTPAAMDLLYRQFVEAGETDVDALIIIALYILDFLCIHPFADGNGRMVRLITVLLLYREDYEVGRYISLERLIERTKSSYYDTLYVSSQGWHDHQHDPMPWVSYFLSVVKAAYEEFSERVGELRGGRGMKTQLVLQAVEQSVGSFSISELHQRCPTVGWDMLRHVLRNEKEAGRLEVVGRGRGARWRRTQDERG